MGLPHGWLIQRTESKGPVRALASDFGLGLRIIDA